MLGAINRMDGANRDWSQAMNPASTNSTEESPADLKETGVETGEGNGKGKDRLLKELEKLNEQMKSTGKSFRFKYSEEAEQFYVQIIDTRSQEVIESIPPEHMIELSAKLKELIGIFVDKKL